MIDKDLTSWSRILDASPEVVLATADYPTNWCKFELFKLEDGNYACHFYAYDAAGGWQSPYFDKVLDKYREWCDGEEKRIVDKHKDPICPKCRHKWYSHESEIKWTEDNILYECGANMGMGNWCGCKEKKQ